MTPIVDKFKVLKDKYPFINLQIALNHLQNLNNNAFLLHYENRPGCLNRLLTEASQIQRAVIK